MSLRTAFFGDAFIDVQTSPMTSLPAWDEDRVVSSVQLIPGGSACNTARHFGSLSPNAQTCLCVTVGDDALGTIMLSTIEKEHHVDVSTVKIAKDTPMSTCLVLVGPDGKRAFVSTRSTSNDLSNAELVYNSGLLKPLQQGGVHHVHVSGLFSTLGLQTKQFVQVLKLAKLESKFTLSIDTQYDATGTWRGTEDVVLDLIVLCDIFVPNHIELLGIMSAYAGIGGGGSGGGGGNGDGDGNGGIEIALEWMMKAAPETLICVKAGPDGAFVGKAGHKIIHISAPVLQEHECLDTCGAGDCFSAAFLSKILPCLYPENDVQVRDDNTFRIRKELLQPSSSAVLEAVEYGCRGGTWCCTQVGACVKTVTEEDL